MAEISFKDTTLHTSGELPKIGSRAPDFTVTKTDLGEIKLRNYLGRKMILNIFPSLDTETCASAMRRFDEISRKYPDVLILCISADLPFAQKRFCAAEHLSNVIPVSVFRHPNFGKDYGVVFIDGPLTGLLSRAVVMLDETGRIIYTEHVPEVTHEPDYTRIMNTLQTTTVQ